MSRVYHIRPARPEDLPLIDRVMHEESGLDPGGNRWEDFMLAETAQGDLAGLGRMKRDPGCNELGSLFVRPAHRNQGLAGQLIRALIASEAGEIHLRCRLELAAYYGRFGFVPVPLREVPQPLRSKIIRARWRGFWRGLRVIGMRLDRSRIDSGEYA